MNLLARGDALLNRKSPVVAGELVRVLRAGTVLCDQWNATPGTTQIELAVDGEVTLVGSRHDWIGDPTKWMFDGAQTNPQRGDTLEWNRGGHTLVFECLPAVGEDVFSPHGLPMDRIRVHTKLIERRSNE